MLKSYVAFDLETTGLSVEENCIIEFGALKVRDGAVADRFMTFVKPEERSRNGLPRLPESPMP